MPLQCHYNSITMPLQCHYNAITMPLQCHYNAIIMPLQCHYNSITMPLQCNYNAMCWGKLKLNIWLTILCFIPNLIIRCTIYEVKFRICVLYVTFKCHPTPAKKFPYNSAELYGNFRTFPQNDKLVRKSVKKNSVHCTEMCGNQIWLRSGLNWLLHFLILTAVKM